ncbi:uncharacterized protein LOC111903530 [Lactuca sativa]|uniref:uncharacterized protein LOC111903530 n=1 Tax=Lactuca sativa TaxID=4236 RepID=UPI001C69374B|nr:uncharacterized protein LOC111903530 [Lactuca sativa]
MIKTQENFETHSLSNLYNILKAHESEAKEIAQENSKLSFGVPLALVSKTTGKEVCSDGEADETEESHLMNYDDEVVDCYSNNMVRKFYKKRIGGNFNNRSVKKSLSNFGVAQKSVKTAEEKKEEKKIKKRLKQDSGYNCNYCNRHNHLTRDCMLKKQEEKNEKVKEEAYYAMKIEELQEKSKNLSMVAKNSTVEDGIYQIWSYGSDDEEMHHPTHEVMYAKHYGDHSEEKSMF